MRRKGFTLIEITIVILLLGIIFSVVTSIYVSALKNNKISFTKSGFQKDLNFTLDDLNKNVKQANAVITPTLPAGLGCVTYCTLNDKTLLLSLPAIDTNGSFKYSADGQTLLTDTFVYYLNGNILHKKIYANAASSRYSQNNTDKIIANNVSNLTFTYLPSSVAPEQVQTDMTMSLTVEKVNVRVTGTDIAFMRNNR
jgi:prepilin-type N-terminal cleavage/methylation domain-containing protein